MYGDHASDPGLAEFTFKRMICPFLTLKQGEYVKAPADFAANPLLGDDAAGYDIGEFDQDEEEDEEAKALGTGSSKSRWIASRTTINSANGSHQYKPTVASVPPVYRAKSEVAAKIHQLVVGSKCTVCPPRTCISLDDSTHIILGHTGAVMQCTELAFESDAFTEGTSDAAALEAFAQFSRQRQQQHGAGSTIRVMSKESRLQQTAANNTTTLVRHPTRPGSTGTRLILARQIQTMRRRTTQARIHLLLVKSKSTQNQQPPKTMCPTQQQNENAGPTVTSPTTLTATMGADGSNQPSACTRRRTGKSSNSATAPQETGTAAAPAAAPSKRGGKRKDLIEMGAANPASSNNPPIIFNAHRKPDAVTFLDLLTDPENLDRLVEVWAEVYPGEQVNPAQLLLSFEVPHSRKRRPTSFLPSNLIDETLGKRAASANANKKAKLDMVIYVFKSDLASKQDAQALSETLSSSGPCIVNGTGTDCEPSMGNFVPTRDHRYLEPAIANGDVFGHAVMMRHLGGKHYEFHSLTDNKGEAVARDPHRVSMMPADCLFTL
ncbi:hypothetical protein BCR44DRAFT_47570 [Catenaria anguillulae PL171]|uniref:Uncharacterized protein n=1 Tax=Catenaria anguillulae PL171 TaxID=765915 RepID=A0A1Y2HL62_9FUNG|nr:hypothetical protein BCR44DRAFT_47570 [Catenaria anguillulae PL171]